jgi:Holliday junction resolvase RusA-like endonuclease
MVEIIIPGAPVAKPRAKGFYNKKTHQMHHYYKNDKVLRSFEQLIKLKAEPLFPQPLSCPICISIHFLLPRPKGMMWKKKDMPRVPNPHRPDIDNCIKTVIDSLNGIAYLDDGQITEIHAKKEYHAGNEGPKTIIKIEEIQ